MLRFGSVPRPGRSATSRKRAWRGLAAAATAAGLLVSGAGVASANNYGPGGLGFKGSGGSPLNLQPVNVATYWHGVIDEGARRWNQSEAYSNLYRLRQGTSAGKIYADYYEWGDYGHYYNTGGAKCVSRGFNIEINARTISRDFPPSGHDGQNKGVMMHEMGHILSLADTPQQASVMGASAALPTKYDTDLVNRYNRVLPCQKGEYS